MYLFGKDKEWRIFKNITTRRILCGTKERLEIRGFH